MGIHLTTGKVTFKSIVFNNQKLLKSNYIESLDIQGREFVLRISKHKIFKEEDVLFPDRDSNKIYFITSGKVYMLYKRKEDGFQKLIKVLEPGDFFAMRKDFKNLYFYIKEPTITFIIDENNLNKVFEIAPYTRNLILNFFRETVKILNSYKYLTDLKLK